MNIFNHKFSKQANQQIGYWLMFAAVGLTMVMNGLTFGEAETAEAEAAEAERIAKVVEDILKRRLVGKTKWGWHWLHQVVYMAEWERDGVPPVLDNAFYCRVIERHEQLIGPWTGEPCAG